MKAQTKFENEVHDKPTGSDVVYCALCFVLAVGITFTWTLFPGEGVFVFFGLMTLVGLIAAIGHHHHF